MIRYAILGLLAVAVNVESAEACSCAPPPPPCEAYWQDTHVFTGQVTAVTETAVAKVTLTVDKVLRGAVGKTVTVSAGGMCGATLQKGKKYIVYTTPDPSGGFDVSLCSRTNELAQAADDLAYVKTIATKKTATIEGLVEIEPETTGGDRTPRAGATVRARGTQLTAKSDAKGRYRLDVTPGTYTLDVEDAGTRMLFGKAPTVTIAHVAACAKRDLVVSWDGRLAGTVRDAAGAPVPNLEVSAIAKDPANQRWRLDARTDAKGAYVIHEVPAGEFRVGVSLDDRGGPSPDSPYPTTFATKQPVATKRGGLVTKLDITLPAKLGVYTISGVVKIAGTPSAGMTVQLQTASRSTASTTDARGAYTVKEIAGAKITVSACHRDVTAATMKQRCREVTHTVAKDATVNLDLP